MGANEEITVVYNVALMKADMAAKGWLPVHLADHASVSAMTVGRFFSGESQTAPTAKKLAEALGKSLKRYIVAPTNVTANHAAGTPR